MPSLVGVEGRQRLDSALSKLGAVFQGYGFDLISTQLLWWHTRGIAGLTEKAVQASRRDHPKKEQFVVGILKTVPGISGDEYRSALVKRVAHIVQADRPTAFENVKSFVRVEVSMDWNACAEGYLLSSPCELIGSCGSTDVDEDVAMIAKMNKMFASTGGEYKSLSGHSVGWGRRAFGHKELAHTEAAQTE